MSIILKDKEPASDRPPLSAVFESAKEPHPVPSPPKRSRAEHLRDRLEGKRKVKEIPVTGTGKTKTLTTIKNAMYDYESTGRRSFALEKIYRAISTINPSSAEAGEN